MKWIPVYRTTGLSLSSCMNLTAGKTQTVPMFVYNYQGNGTDCANPQILRSRISSSWAEALINLRGQLPQDHMPDGSSTGYVHPQWSSMQCFCWHDVAVCYTEAPFGWATTASFKLGSPSVIPIATLFVFSMGNIFRTSLRKLKKQSSLCGLLWTCWTQPPWHLPPELQAELCHSRLVSFIRLQNCGITIQDSWVNS